MHYSELNEISLDRENTKISVARLKSEYKIEAPDLVISQFYVDHSDDEVFQGLYGMIDLKAIRWSLLKLNADCFSNIGNNATHPEYMREVSEGVALYRGHSDSMISPSKDIREHWKTYGTWKVPPIFINREIISSSKYENKLHLVEGHTRVGCLLGLLDCKSEFINRYQEVYYGDLQ